MATPKREGIVRLQSFCVASFDPRRVHSGERRCPASSGPKRSRCAWDRGRPRPHRRRREKGPPNAASGELSARHGHATCHWFFKSSLRNSLKQGIFPYVQGAPSAAPGTADVLVRIAGGERKPPDECSVGRTVTTARSRNVPPPFFQNFPAKFPEAGNFDWRAEQQRSARPPAVLGRAARPRATRSQGTFFHFSKSGCGQYTESVCQSTKKLPSPARSLNTPSAGQGAPPLLKSPTFPAPGTPR